MTELKPQREYKNLLWELKRASRACQDYKYDLLLEYDDCDESWDSSHKSIRSLYDAAVLRYNVAKERCYAFAKEHGYSTARIEKVPTP